MPRISWQSLPAGVKQHLVERLRDREITQDDLEALKQWIATDPEVPEGPWCKSFGSFTLAGEGKLPKTFLRRHQPCLGRKL
jgi:hypothetical protein